MPLKFGTVSCGVLVIDNLSWEVVQSLRKRERRETLVQEPMLLLGPVLLSGLLTAASVR